MFPFGSAIFSSIGFTCTCTCSLFCDTAVVAFVYTAELCYVEKYLDIGMVRDNQLGIMGSDTFWQNFSFKKNAYIQASFFHFTITYFVQLKI